MTNEIILVPKEESNGTLPAPLNEPSPKKEPLTTDNTEKKLPDPAREIPITHWIMPPEQHGYIQANDKDCL